MFEVLGQRRKIINFFSFTLVVENIICNSKIDSLCLHWWMPFSMHWAKIRVKYGQSVLCGNGRVENRKREVQKNRLWIEMNLQLDWRSFTWTPGFQCTLSKTCNLPVLLTVSLICNLEIRALNRRGLST